MIDKTRLRRNIVFSQGCAGRVTRGAPRVRVRLVALQANDDRDPTVSWRACSTPATHSEAAGDAAPSVLRHMRGCQATRGVQTDGPTDLRNVEIQPRFAAVSLAVCLEHDGCMASDHLSETDSCPGKRQSVSTRSHCSPETDSIADEPARGRLTQLKEPPLSSRCNV
jgi:hypothetical protein